ncbi:gamma-glutamylcysteine synthetase [Babesia ovis]|uniref:Glutamate--cysteine ligase n=1 Tax=Babesia ovis TaxID=5869 RepID=A0A9W5WWA0_BABOV|nr:gamma-glutamylcysteine synthetase [Babesia ovis]
MGFLTVGAPLSFGETASRADRIRMLGTLQLLRCYLQNRGRTDETRCFGHECEYMLIHLNPRTREAKLMPCAPHLMKNVPVVSEPDADRYHFMPEFGSFMVECTPKEPWKLDEDYILELAQWFRGARRHMRLALESMGLGNVYPFTLTSFPLLGTPNSVCEYPMRPLVREPAMLSDFCSDILVNPHPRFGTLARNIRKRRGRKVCIIAPPFIQHVAIEAGFKRMYTGGSLMDVSSLETNADDYPPGQLQMPEDDFYPPGETLGLCNGSYSVGRDRVISEDIQCSILIDDPELGKEIDHLVSISDVRDVSPATCTEPKRFYPIYMDAMVFGMGMCCLQATFSCVDEEEARYLYDQLAVLSPLFLALTAATAAFKGTMSSHTTRWRVLSQAVDDRRDEELERIRFSRFSTVSLYISKEQFLLANYKKLNDVPVPSRKDVYHKCVEGGLDKVISRHFAAVLSRPPLVAFEEDLNEVDVNATDAHFETFQSTNWNTVRFKPPPLQNGSYPIPWRVEFRCCEAQLRDRESLAVVAVVALMVKVLLKERWNLYIPMSMVHQNMEASDAQDAIINHRFHFVNSVTGAIPIKEKTIKDGTSESTARRTIPSTIIGNHAFNATKASGDTNPPLGGIGRYTLREIFFTNEHLGLFHRCINHLEMELQAGEISLESYEMHMENLKMMKGRMYGTHATNAQELRNYFLSHRDFSGNGAITQKMVYDMLSALSE